MTSIRALYPWLRHVFADCSYAGDELRDATAAPRRWTIRIIKRSDAVKGFAVLKRRWVVERTGIRQQTPPGPDKLWAENGF